MAQFTQLNLGGKSRSSNAAPQSQVTHRKPTVALVGTVLATAMAGVFLIESSACSKSKPVAIAAPPQPAVTQPAVTPPAPTPALTAEQKPKKSPRQAKAATYKNKDYGISLVYPKSYELKEGDDAALEWTGMGPVQMNFVESGGSTIAAVELPKNSYPDTDFAGGFVNVSVHPTMAEQQCSQFAFPETTDNAAATPAKVKLGSSEFSEIESAAGDESNQADAKYYHAFENGRCYEFALGIQTARDAGQDIPQVDRQRVFNRLKRILTTVKITPAEEKPAEVVVTPRENTTISQK
jgi:hypothetical protein